MREGFSVSEREARQQKSASSKPLDAAGSDIFPFFFSSFSSSQAWRIGFSCLVITILFSSFELASQKPEAKLLM